MTAETLEKSLSESAPLVTASINDDKRKESTEEKVCCEPEAENLTAVADKPSEGDESVDADDAVKGEEMPDVSVEDVVEEQKNEQLEAPAETSQELKTDKEETTGSQVTSSRDDVDDGKSEVEKSVEKADSLATEEEKNTNDVEEAVAPDSKSLETKNEKVLEEVGSVNLKDTALSEVSSGEASPDDGEAVLLPALNKVDDDKAKSTTASPKPTIEAKKRLSPDPPQGVPDAKKVAAISENDIQE